MLKCAELVVDNNWLAIDGWDESRPDVFKVKLWKEELFRRDIELPGVSAGQVCDVVMESPLLDVGRLTGWIKVFSWL